MIIGNGSTQVKNDGTLVSSAPALNFLSTDASVTITVTDDPANNEVDIDLSASDGGGGGDDQLGDLQDVSLSSVTDGQALVYNNTSGLWENQTISSTVSDTRENLLVTTPDNNTLAYATDTKQFYIYNTKWFAISNITGVPNERTSSQINAGVFQSSSETSGYSSKYISGKGISNSSIGGFDDTNYAVKNGAIRYNDTSKQFQVYIDEWKALRALSPSEVVNITVYTALRQKDGKGRFMVQHGFINAGALASSYLIDGGSF